MSIEAVKPAIKVAAELRNVTAQAFADGKFQVMEAFGYVPALMQVQAIVESGPTILAELKDATHAERAELEAYAIEELKIEKADVESFIADSIDWVIATLQLFISGQNLRQARNLVS